MNARQDRRPVLAMDMMTRALFTVREEEHICDVVRVLVAKRFSGAPVVDDAGRLIGMLSEKDCIAALMRAVIHNTPGSRVRDVMNRELTTVDPEDHLLTIANHFLYKHRRRLPVVDESGKLVGQISRSDLLAKALSIFDAAPNRASAILYLSAIAGTVPPR